jgi:hypothetical protein
VSPLSLGHRFGQISDRKNAKGTTSHTKASIKGSAASRTSASDMSEISLIVSEFSVRAVNCTRGSLAVFCGDASGLSFPIKMPTL